VAKTIDDSQDLEALDKAKEAANFSRVEDDAMSEVLPHSKYRLF